MSESVYRVTEVIGVSADSWEQAARNAVETVAGSVRELRIAEVVRQDVTIEEGKSRSSGSGSGSPSSTTKSRFGGVRGGVGGRLLYRPGSRLVDTIPTLSRRPA